MPYILEKKTVQFAIHMHIKMRNINLLNSKESGFLTLALTLISSLYICCCHVDRTDKTGQLARAGLVGANVTTLTHFCDHIKVGSFRAGN